MKIAITTWYHFRNYGTALQVVALNKVIKSNGYEVDTVQHIPHGYYRGLNDYTIKSVINRVLNKIRIKIQPHKQVRYYDNDKKKKLFDDFIKQHVSFTNKCTNKTELEQLNSLYDVFICGSDQIWAPSLFDPVYFLDYVSDDQKKIAYAPSLGLSQVDDEYVRERITEQLQRFRFLSVRESKGIEIIRNLIGRDAELVCDPTLLLTEEEWIELTNKEFHIRNKYILCYMLGNSANNWKTINIIAKKLHIELKTIPVYDSDLSREGCIQSSIGPAEFLQLFYEAEYICTDSYHGILFSCIFHKQFTAFERFSPKDPVNQNSRIYSILEILHLNNRLYKDHDYQHVTEKIDYLDVEKRLSSFRSYSLDYLLQAIKTVQDRIPEKEKNHVLIHNSICCGCGVCKAICPTQAIAIEIDENGFFKAKVKESTCVSCGKCITVCPNENVKRGTSIYTQELYSYKSNSTDTLLFSSSGGVAFDISRFLLDDGYTIVGCQFNRDKQRAEHIIVTEKQNISLLQGSKYLQSDFSNVVNKLQYIITPIVVFGTPCQIAAARKLLQQRNDVIYIDLICHGVPSYLLFESYKKHLNDTYGISLEGFNIVFRYKQKGWRKIYLYSYNRDKEVCLSQDDDLFFRMFEAGNCYMEACYECQWRDQSQADIRIGDYWGNRFINDKSGVSMVIPLTQKGKNLLVELGKTKVGNLDRHPMDDLLSCQQTVNLPKPVYYEEVIEKLQKNCLTKAMVKKYAKKYNMTRMEKIRYTLSMILLEYSERFKEKGSTHK